MPTKTVNDLEREYLQQALGSLALPTDTINDLRAKFYKGVVEGSGSLASAVQNGRLVPVGSLSFSLSATPTLRPFAVGSDGVVYGRFGGALFVARLNSDGSALNGSFNFATLPEHSGGGALRFATRTEAGYVAVTVVGTTTYIWFSTSFTSGWVKKVTIADLSNEPLGIPNPQTTLSGKTVLFVGIWNSGITQKPMYASFDGGQNWTLIKQTWASPPDATGTINSHWHTAVYHPRKDRIWVSAGDGVNSYFGYSNDRGVTWHDVAATDTPVYDGKTYQQPTQMVPFDDRISIGPDRGNFNPGIWEMDPMTGYSVPQFVVDATVSSADKQYPVSPFAQKGNVAYVAFPASSSMPVGTRDHTDIVATGDGGRSWYKVATIPWNAVDLSSNGIVGPDANGYLYHVGSAGMQKAMQLGWTV